MTLIIEITKRKGYALYDLRNSDRLTFMLLALGYLRGQFPWCQ